MNASISHQCVRTMGSATMMMVAMTAFALDNLPPVICSPVWMNIICNI